MTILRFLVRHARALGALLIIAAIPVVATAVHGVFLLQRLEAEPRAQATALFTSDGELLTSLGEQAGLFVPFSRIPKHVRDAVVAIEDSRFWSHRGVDLAGIARAVLVNLREGRRAQGGSTITQQLAKNLFLSPAKSFVRKFQEAIYALLIEARYSKSEILALYLNQIYFGEGAYGIEEAARIYFEKSTPELTLSDGALLAGLLRAPSRYSPHVDQEVAIARRSLVLERMADLELITPEEAHAAKSAPLEVAPRRGGQAPYFADYVESWLVERFGANRVFHGGLLVTTTLDMTAQRAAEAALDAHQGAIVVLDPATGHILAMVGGRDYLESQYNRATQSRRQPGSAFKPFVYASALEAGWQMNDLVDDSPRAYGEYAPRNFRDEYWGNVTMKHALVESLNNGTVWLLGQIGVDRVMTMARRLGITTLTQDDRHLALALGGLTHGVSVLEMAAAYAVFANGGTLYEPTAILEVHSADGALLYRNNPRGRRVLSQEVAYFITDMLRDAVLRGTGSPANIGRPQAGKTGTTNDLVSAWFVGYTPDMAAAVYVGNDDGTPLTGGGGTIAAPIWRKLMIDALRGVPAADFPVPDFVETGVPVDIFTGLLATEACAFRERDAFVRGRAPSTYAPCAFDYVPPPDPFLDPRSELGLPPEPPESPGLPGLPGLPEPTPDDLFDLRWETAFDQSDPSE